MGCTGSINALLPKVSKRPLLTTNNIHSNKDLPSPVAFVVPLYDNNEDAESFVIKHPPKRFQKLEEQQTSPLSHKMLQDKLTEAEQRRLQILNGRIKSAKIMMRPKCTNGNDKPLDDLISEADTPD